jgi:uncharacterized protein (DUF433 family)
VCNGKPVIRGTRQDHLEADESCDNILKGFPGLEKEDIAVAIYYARKAIEHTEFEEREDEGNSDFVGSKVSP